MSRLVTMSELMLDEILFGVVLADVSKILIIFAAPSFYWYGVAVSGFLQMLARAM